MKTYYWKGKAHFYEGKNMQRGTASVCGRESVWVMKGGEK